MLENEVSPQVVQILETESCVLFRNNIGCAKFGQRWVHYGLGGKGGSDQIGFMRVKITKEMVGHILPIFCAIETKRSNGGEHAQKQIDFLKVVNDAGGVAGFAHSWQHAKRIVDDWRAKFAIAKSVKKK